jgi:hypothetical protein
MKFFITLAIGTCLTLAATSETHAQFKDFELTVTRKKLDESDRSSDGAIINREKEIVYNVAVRNLRFKESKPVEVKYRVYYADVILGSTSKPPEKVVEGSASVPAIAGGKTHAFETEKIKLGKSELAAGW